MKIKEMSCNRGFNGTSNIAVFILEVKVKNRYSDFKVKLDGDNIIDSFFTSGGQACPTNEIMESYCEGVFGFGSLYNNGYASIALQENDLCKEYAKKINPSEDWDKFSSEFQEIYHNKILPILNIYASKEDLTELEGN